MLWVPVGRLFCIVPIQTNQTDLNSIVRLWLAISAKFCTQISWNRCRVGTFEWHCMIYPLFRVPLIPSIPYSITSYSIYPLFHTPYSFTPRSFTSWSGYVFRGNPEAAVPVNEEKMRRNIGKNPVPILSKTNTIVLPWSLWTLRKLVRLATFLPIELCNLMDQ